MFNYICRRLMGIMPLLFGITLISFFIIHLAPGKPTQIEQSLNPRVSQEVRLRLEKLYGLDKPLHIQYIEWIKKMARFDFGTSFLDNRPVTDKIIERMLLTFTVNFASLFLVFLIAVPLGVRSALKQG
jgi:peptide/nickel transport system permease protein